MQLQKITGELAYKNYNALRAIMIDMRKYLFTLLMIFITACSLNAAPPIPTATVVIPTATMVTLTPLPTRTLAPYEEYTIDYLRRRAYGGGQMEIVEKLGETDLFTSYSIR